MANNLQSCMVSDTGYTGGYDDDDSESGGYLGGGQGSMNPLLLAALVLLVIVIVVAGYRYWCKTYRAKPDCAAAGALGAPCSLASRACGGDGACLNAVAHCMPAATAMANGTQPPAGAVSACARAISHVEPSVIAGIITKNAGPSACVPSQAASHLAGVDPKAVAMLASTAVSVAQSLPTCGGNSLGRPVGGAAMATAKAAPASASRVDSAMSEMYGEQYST